MAKTPIPRVHKVIFLANYAPNLRYYDLFRSAAAKLPDFPHWATDEHSVTMRDFKARCSVTIQFNSIGFSQDSDVLATEEARLNQVLGILPQELRIDSFSRLGYRRQYLISVNMAFDSLVSILGLKLLSSEERLQQIVPGKTTDLLYRVDCTDGEYKFHVHLGPVHKREIPRWIPLQGEDHLAPEVRAEETMRILSAYPDVATLIDIDVFRAEKELTLEQARAFLPTARTKINDLVGKFNEYLFSQELK